MRCWKCVTMHPNWLITNQANGLPLNSDRPALSVARNCFWFISNHRTPHPGESLDVRIPTNACDNAGLVGDRKLAERFDAQEDRVLRPKLPPRIQSIEYAYLQYPILHHPTAVKGDATPAVPGYHRNATHLVRRSQLCRAWEVLRSR